MIYCYCNFFGNTFKVYLKDTKLYLDQEPKILSFKEMKDIIENIEEITISGVHYCEINDLDTLLNAFEVFEKKGYNTKNSKLFLTLRNFSMCSN